MRKFKFLTVILTFMVFLGSFAACNQDNSSSQSSTPTHTCESVCEECGKCTDEACTEEACADKCEGHTVVPEHTCESKCPTCNKCLDADCTETACADKCEGHTVVPEHTCESKCPTCNKCLDADCTETACADKCEGHTVVPEHTCESKCPTCNKCLDADCTEEACAEKCEGHTVVPEHTCESVCPTCNKCLDATCTEEACEDKCEGHTPAPTHTCESKCPTCNKCLDADCTETACAEKCEGHVPPHACQSVCTVCGDCMNVDCTEEVCEDKCPGHTVSDDWDSFELSFMTFNINWAASSASADTGVTSWSNRKEEVLRFINNSGAHIIGLQEVAEWNADVVNQRLYLEQNLASKYELIYFGKIVSLGMIYDKTVFNLVRQEHYWLSATPDVQSTCWEDTTLYRMAAILVLEHKVTGEIVKAINTHGPLSDNLSLKCFDLIANRSLSGENDPVTVMMGDFNAQPGDPGYNEIAEKLQDCRVTAEESPNREKNTYNGYKATPELENKNRLIDFCFISNYDYIRVLKYQVHDDRFGEGWCRSDHHAVQTHVRIYNDSNKAWTGFY